MALGQVPRRRARVGMAQCRQQRHLRDRGQTVIGGQGGRDRPGMAPGPGGVRRSKEPEQHGPVRRRHDEAHGRYRQQTGGGHHARRQEHQHRRRTIDDLRELALEARHFAPDDLAIRDARREDLRCLRRVRALDESVVGGLVGGGAASLRQRQQVEGEDPGHLGEAGSREPFDQGDRPGPGHLGCAREGAKTGAEAQQCQAGAGPKPAQRASVAVARGHGLRWCVIDKEPGVELVRAHVAGLGCGHDLRHQRKRRDLAGLCRLWPIETGKEQGGEAQPPRPQDRVEVGLRGRGRTRG